MNGDFVKHNVALPDIHNATKEQKLATWDRMKVIIKHTTDAVRSKFPNTPFLPTIGNNDVIVHD